jgi:NADPH2:quinone reductase
MLAAFYTRKGAARDVLSVGEQPTPVPGPGEVRVRLAASGVNPSDWKSRAGTSSPVMTDPLVIPHSDGAGVIDMTGPGVSRRVGERVWLWNGQWKRAHGTAAEYIAVPQEQAVPLPDGVGFAEGACLGIPALTAMHAVRISGLEGGQTVLVQGGAGSVAQYAIQFAKLRGARVIATVSGEAKAAHAREAGADATVNYRHEDLGARVKELTQGRGVDAVIELDVAANARTYPTVLRPHGTVVVYGSSAAEGPLPGQWLMRNSISLRFFLVYELAPLDRAVAIEEITGLLKAGKLRHAVGKHLPLAAIAEAHDIVEKGSVMGHVVLDIGSPA